MLYIVYNMIVKSKWVMVGNFSMIYVFVTKRQMI